MPGNASLSVGYLHFRGLHLILSRNVNVPRFPASAGVPNLGRPDPNFGNICRFESSGDSYYNGLVVSFNKRMSEWASVRTSYTLSKTIDKSGNFFFSTPQNNFDLRDDRGLSDNDQRHRLTLSGLFEAPRSRGESVFRRALEGFELSFIFTYASALPFNVLTSSDRNFDTSFNDRPLGVGRNTGRGFDFASLDLRLSKRFRFASSSDSKRSSKVSTRSNAPTFKFRTTTSDRVSRRSQVSGTDRCRRPATNAIRVESGVLKSNAMQFTAEAQRTQRGRRVIIKPLRLCGEPYIHLQPL